MKLVRLEDVPASERVNHAREGKFIYYQLLEGEEGSADNYSLQLVHLSTDFFSPRHRHNFDQVRFQVGGSYDFDRNGKLNTGSVGYFPEGAYYGPQKSLTTETKLLVLQFGGASGQGYMTEATYDRGVAELKAQGVFQNGIFTRTAADGSKKNRDAYEAVWEHMNGRSLDYPPVRYQAPVFMEPSSHSWRPVENAAGVRERRLGVFTDRGVSLGFFDCAAGSRHRLDGPAIFFVTKGAGKTAAGGAWGAHSALRLEGGEAIVLNAEEDAEILAIGLPPVAATVDFSA